MRTGLPSVAGYARAKSPKCVAKACCNRAVFESPVVHTPQRGRDITFKYLASAEQVLGGPAFRYVGEWRNASGAVLEFETEIDGIRINGVDMIAFSDDGARITHFKVMVRPLKAINLLHQMMGAQLAKA